MPKRVPTPEPGDSEPRYFTVVQPYPRRANWENEGDRIKFGRWIASCIGSSSLYDLFYKPRAAGNQVIIEVDRSYAYPERLLGEHRWDEFLQDPDDDEKGCVSKVFFCTYTSGREVQKNGWKRIEVAYSWFSPWPPSEIHCDPYPTTHWCPLPPEDRTNQPMCRPLPASIKPGPALNPSAKAAAAPRPAVPGSAAWASSKGVPLSKGRAQSGSAVIPTRQPDKKKMRAIPANSTAEWHTVLHPTSKSTTPIFSTTDSPEVPGKRFPKLGTLPAEVTSWSDQVELEEEFRSQRIDFDPDDVDEYISEPPTPLPPWPEADTRSLYGPGPEPEYIDDPDTFVAEWEKGSGTAKERALPSAPVGGQPKKAPIVCPEHGKSCPRGICSVYSKLKKERARAEKAGTQAEAKSKRGDTRKFHGERKSATKDETTEDQNPSAISTPTSEIQAQDETAPTDGWRAPRRPNKRGKEKATAEAKDGASSPPEANTIPIEAVPDNAAEEPTENAETAAPKPPGSGWTTKRRNKRAQ
ncbi:unnamed protein product [Mycena citricolor]|uniref:Uncharacterized protein n=1 Tax=Mycena citricolor TaxID=2018698 RepID=A0AAD2HM16_9AGAR|nr:unnamed protein product [Mycena citricolor]